MNVREKRPQKSLDEIYNEIEGLIPKFTKVCGNC